MKKFLFMLITFVALLFVGPGVISAATDYGPTDNLGPLVELSQAGQPQSITIVTPGLSTSGGLAYQYGQEYGIHSKLIIQNPGLTALFRYGKPQLKPPNTGNKYGILRTKQRKKGPDALPTWRKKFRRSAT